MNIKLIRSEILDKMEKAGCYAGVIEIETKLFGIEHSYVYYNIEDDLLNMHEDLEGIVLDDVRLNWFITDDEIIEYMQEIRRKYSRR